MQLINTTNDFLCARCPNHWESCNQDGTYLCMCIRKPGQTMDMGTPSMLSLKPQLAISCSMDSSVEDLDKLHDPMIEETVCKSWVVSDYFRFGSH